MQARPLRSAWCLQKTSVPAANSSKTDGMIKSSFFIDVLIPPFSIEYHALHGRGEPFGMRYPVHLRQFVFFFKRIVLHQKLVAAGFDVAEVLVQVDALVFHVEQAACDV